MDMAKNAAYRNGAELFYGKHTILYASTWSLRYFRSTWVANYSDSTALITNTKKNRNPKQINDKNYSEAKNVMN